MFENMNALNVIWRTRTTFARGIELSNTRFRPRTLLPGPVILDQVGSVVVVVELGFLLVALGFVAAQVCASVQSRDTRLEWLQ